MFFSPFFPIIFGRRIKKQHAVIFHNAISLRKQVHGKFRGKMFDDLIAQYGGKTGVLKRQSGAQIAANQPQPRRTASGLRQAVNRAFGSDAGNFEAFTTFGEMAKSGAEIENSAGFSLFNAFGQMIAIKIPIAAVGIIRLKKAFVVNGIIHSEIIFVRFQNVFS